MTNQRLNKLSNCLIGAAIEVHSQLGPGLLESVYQQCLFYELRNRKIKFQAQHKTNVIYKGVDTFKEFYVDFLVEDNLVLELKAVEHVLPIHKAQLLTYLKLTNNKLGLLINFNELRLKDGISRVVHNF